MNTQLMFSSDDQTWETPMRFFQKLNYEFNFTLDVCATHLTAKCAKYFTPEIDGLAQDWSNDTCWCNPPYGNSIYTWLQKAYNESLKGAIVVVLIPSRTDTRYFVDLVMKASEIRFVKGRLKFGNSANSAPFPSMVVVFDRNKVGLKVTSYNRDYIVPIAYSPVKFL